MKANIFKTLLVTTMVFAAATASACWFQYKQYNDYIYGINNFINHTTVIDNGTDVEFTVQNNQIVDLPCSVSINLEQNTQFTNPDDAELTSEITCELQYRLVNDKEWTTVVSRTFSKGEILPDSLPAFYLGRNNINPKGLNAGDVIMIRLQVYRGISKAGEEDDLCKSKLIDNKFQDKYQYTLKADVNKSTEFDLGGGWIPHRVTTVVFSGNYRPVR